MKQFKNVNHKRHYLTWMWMSRHPDKEEYDCPIVTKFLPPADSFACAEAIERSYYPKGRCRNCPIIWGPSNVCEIGKTLYTRWHATKKTEIAVQIANMEWE